ncbi:pilus assembly protein TadG-related protein [Lutimaribacter sp. EGI FJ00015]|uniref:Pilus assembly protein TadG-related protein n=1 Tax=Lutimaribacter degradans TaxID=2945989 RepID=A0ACC5ZTQ6_9RHOB|nr:pilus assembly protein TadG-related protein [Lutimaribacter sp. EGI FJ00013]MCM2560774.1 pilus assembly protein TadG-related protein [Lutimaribacter sp. EGI FJ00013]MCO0612280.1 pilus assembly protein TadG-related protein [Lutimaribacter sp. EGI FJ00015]MCO0634599.1 pilus assembly protein TadG-related protein [Lutimaribacter sp. EGI FJ00014]
MADGFKGKGAGSARRLYPDRAALRFFRRFHKEEDGVMLVFSIMVLMMILLIGGIGVDLMRHEMTRTRLQATLDRAVLAAADLDQPLNPTGVVEDYFAKSNMADYLTNVTVREGINFRNVEASAAAEMKTTLIHMAGIKTLTAPAHGAAEERIANVEVSLVLDISGSMANNNKMANMQSAARRFIDTVLRGDDNDNVSVSLVPYSEHVNIGEDLFSLIDTKHFHDYSYCVEVPDGHMQQTWLNQGHQFDQAQHFQWNFDGWNNDRSNTICPRFDYETVTTFSRNASALKAQIDQFRPRAGTSIFLGMKWGVALLDPESNNIVQGMVGKGKADSVFADRPKSFTDHETLKTVILMTDGKNDYSHRIAPWYYRNDSHYVHWNRYNFWWYLNYEVRKHHYNNWYREYYNPTTGDALTHHICEAAKTNGIIIWSIGFEVDDHGADVMRDCASSPSHFFRVEGIEIREAFEAIARQINQLRLTQ